ncbi:gfo/Idh/MocA family oxidoreductase [Kaistia algarum]|uniref:Gfo/Idh/MocA family protein n=1 Tax=Kaistia algarum TaxID=2083279 RepID=UPI000CE8FB67|nr:Gfo/Idh/MocA family oxidoreductase [Kaistia algarum]MCX5512044.1 Gfo/Idh/MocA family oxidoreductase [Kaistia algarum]PPE80169.1 gfo/Idh/MocA family oxidoreductase [Kaistia algarum]
MAEDRRIRVSVVGAGNWGLQHARVLAARDDVEFTSVVGRSAEKVAARAAAFGVRGYTSIAAMIAAEAPDLVCVSLPNEAHFAATMEIIEAGVPLFVEKPLVFVSDEADRLIAEAERRGVFFAINFNHRYARPAVMAKQAIASGRLGRIVFASWRFGGEGGLSHAFNNLIETQCHGFDMLEFLCGPIDSVMAELTDMTAPGTFRSMALALHFRDGAVGSLIGSYDTSYAYPDTHRVEVSGTTGRLVIEDTVRRYTFNPHGSETAEVWQAGYFNDRDRSFYQTFDHHMGAVIAALRAGSPPPVHARAGRRALMIAEAAIRSFRSGTRVTIETGSFDAAPPPELGAAPANP